MSPFPNQQHPPRPRESALRDARLQQLIDSCQQEVLRQLIGPFGLNTAMFDDKNGGNVATVHNAEQSIFPDQQHEGNYALAKDPYSQEMRQKHLDDKGARGDTHAKNNAALDAGKEVLSAVTNRPMNKGEINGDHTISLKEAHGDKALHLRFSEEERKKMLNDPRNMAFIEESINKSKGERTWEQCLADPEFVAKHKLSSEDIKRIKENDRQARRFLSTEKNKRLAGELLETGAKEAGRNALRQAMGVLLQEFVNSSFVELKTLISERTQDNLIDRLIQSLQRVLKRVIDKLGAALQSAVQGGIQGFASNLLTFLINNLITTSKKVVSIIRESMQKLWEAIKLIASPPADMPSMEIARQVTKIIAAVVTTGLGMMMEESVKGFIMSVPVLVPIGEILAAGVTAIITGVTGALVVYGIDRLFDWFSSTGTELLTLQEANAEAQSTIALRLETLIGSQYENSKLYAQCAADYEKIQAIAANISFKLECASIEADGSIQARNAVIDAFDAQLDRRARLANALNSI
jgi:hypothetical protein